MKLYKTYSNDQINGISCIGIIELKIVRWAAAPLQVAGCDLTDWEHSRILKGTVTPKYWVLR
jgi:hypothetical protein